MYINKDYVVHTLTTVEKAYQQHGIHLVTFVSNEPYTLDPRRLSDIGFGSKAKLVNKRDERWADYIHDYDMVAEYN